MNLVFLSSGVVESGALQVTCQDTIRQSQSWDVIFLRVAEMSISDEGSQLGSSSVS